MKIIYWFEMITDYEDSLFSQIDEGTQKVIWLKLEKNSEILDNSYENIKLLFEI